MSTTNGSLIIFGFTGDLSKRKLMPSLYNLEKDGRLDGDFHIIGVARRTVDIDELKKTLAEFIVKADGSCDDTVLSRLLSRVDIAESDISKPEDYSGLKDQINSFLPSDCVTKLFYFAVPPNLFEPIINNMVQAGIESCGNGAPNRLLIEKPFGHSLESAQALVDTIEPHFGEESIYRIDHYLAKDTAQSILHFRFHNPIAKALWDAKSISSIQVSAMEFIDIQGRADFYERAGALRDMLQGHLLQLLALVTMDEPSSLEAVDVRRQRQLLLQSIKPLNVDEDAVRGQYEGYRDEVDNQDSLTETYAALRLHIDSSEWRGVPMYLRAGKAMETKFTEVNIVFEAHDGSGERNVITFRLQPSEGIAIKLVTKRPGLSDETANITLDYCYDGSHGELSDAYDRILYDALRGDQTLFPTDTEIINNWRLLQPVINEWSQDDIGLELYPKGTADLLASHDMLAQDDNSWVINESWVCTPKH